MPPSKKRKVVDFKWVDENIVSQIPEECIKKVKSLQESVDQWKQNKESTGLPSLQAGSLQPADVFKIFKFHYQEELEFKFTDEDLVEIPTELVVGSSSSPNEALSCAFINLVIFSCLLEERMLLDKSTKKAQPKTSSSFVPPFTPPRMIPENPASASRQDICVYFETEIRQAISFKGTDYVLSGIADYSLGYNNDNTGSGNLVVVEAKRRYLLHAAYGQLLAYVGMIHTARKTEGSIIFGVATDGFYYHFWRIDNNSNVGSIYHFYLKILRDSGDIFDHHLRLEQESERQHIYSIFRSILRAAILTTPTTSPVKPEYLGEHFQYVNHPKLDFGARSLWQNLFTIEGDNPEVEIIEIPTLAGWQKRIESSDDDIGVEDER